MKTENTDTNFGIDATCRCNVTHCNCYNSLLPLFSGYPLRPSVAGWQITTSYQGLWTVNVWRRQRQSLLACHGGHCVSQHACACLWPTIRSWYMTLYSKRKSVILNSHALPGSTNAVPSCWWVLCPTRKETSYSDKTLTFASH